ncbi:MAG: NYN domain-containing protein [Desulfobacterales bacterium]|nr:NYN domain-containing protein [Desulfobacterales bacterium]
MENNSKLAVLIDAENAQPSIVDGLMAEIANYGTASVKRSYGDWTGPGLKGWKDVLLQHSIQPIQQFVYTKGKNATDIAKQSPDFDPRNYGYGKLGELVTATKLFDTEERQIGAAHSKAIYVRDKRKK